MKDQNSLLPLRVGLPCTVHAVRPVPVMPAQLSVRTRLVSDKISPTMPRTSPIWITDPLRSWVMNRVLDEPNNSVLPVLADTVPVRGLLETISGAM